MLNSVIFEGSFRRCCVFCAESSDELDVLLDQCFGVFVLDVLVGYAETTMAQVLGTNEQMMTMPLSHPKTGNRPRGTVSIRMDELEHQHDLVTLKLRALQARHF